MPIFQENIGNSEDNNIRVEQDSLDVECRLRTFLEGKRRSKLPLEINFKT